MTLLFRLLLLAALLLTSASLFSCGDGDGRREPEAERPWPTSYPETARGLQDLVTDLLRAARLQDGSRLSAMCADLVLREPRSFFEQHFPPGLAADLTRDEERSRKEGLAAFLASTFRKLVQERRDREVEAEEHTRARPGDATSLQRAALEEASAPLTLYTATCSGARTAPPYRFWSFVHANGGFRFVGRMPAAGG